MLNENVTPYYPPLQVRAGVLVVDGFGISLSVRYGKLRVEDGIGRQRRSLDLDRAGSGVERLVLIGHAGALTLEALRWLRAIGAAFVQIGRDGELITHSVPFGYDGHPIRRAQALAVTNGLDLAIARELSSTPSSTGSARTWFASTPNCASSMRCENRCVAQVQSRRSARSKRTPPRTTSLPGRTCRFAFANATSRKSRFAGFAPIRGLPY